MILTARTLAILKNFATINPSIQIKQGAVLSTISPQKTVMARAEIDQEFDRTFAIYDLSRFLGVLSLFASPEVVTDNDSYLTIKEGRQKVKYMFTDPSMIMTPPEKQIQLPSTDAQFTLEADVFSKVMKALAVMQMTELAVVGDGENIWVKTMDVKGAIQDSFSIEVGESSKIFTTVLKAENLKLVSSGYDVRISKAGLVRFSTIDSGINYWIAAEASSSFSE
jgi:hypothetical protein